MTHAVQISVMGAKSARIRTDVVKVVKLLEVVVAIFPVQRTVNSMICWESKRLEKPFNWGQPVGTHIAYDPQFILYSACLFYSETATLKQVHLPLLLLFIIIIIILKIIK